MIKRRIIRLFLIANALLFFCAPSLIGETSLTNSDVSFTAIKKYFEKIDSLTCKASITTILRPTVEEPNRNKTDHINSLFIASGNKYLIKAQSGVELIVYASRDDVNDSTYQDGKLFTSRSDKTKINVAQTSQSNFRGYHAFLMPFVLLLEIPKRNYISVDDIKINALDDSLLSKIRILERNVTFDGYKCDVYSIPTDSMPFRPVASELKMWILNDKVNFPILQWEWSTKNRDSIIKYKITELAKTNNGKNNFYYPKKAEQHWFSGGEATDKNYMTKTFVIEDIKFNQLENDSVFKLDPSIANMVVDMDKDTVK